MGVKVFSFFLSHNFNFKMNTLHQNCLNTQKNKQFSKVIAEKFCDLKARQFDVSGKMLLICKAVKAIFLPKLINQDFLLEIETIHLYTLSAASHKHFFPKFLDSSQLRKLPNSKRSRSILHK